MMPDVTIGMWSKTGQQPEDTDVVLIRITNTLSSVYNLGFAGFNKPSPSPYLIDTGAGYVEYADTGSNINIGVPVGISELRIKGSFLSPKTKKSGVRTVGFYGSTTVGFETNELIFGDGCGIVEFPSYSLGVCRFSNARLVLPSTLRYIKSNAFAESTFVLNVTGLSEVYCKAEIPPLCETNAFNKVNAPGVVYVPRNSVDLYKSASGWSAFGDLIKPMD